MIKTYKLDELSTNLKAAFDLFICSASFEGRCQSISKNIDIKSIKKAIVFYGKKPVEYVEKSNNELKALWDAKADSIELDYSDPLATADMMIRTFERIKEEIVVSSVLIDITTFPREALLILIRLLGLLFSDKKITFVYASASDYNPKNDRDKKWLSKGVREIRSVLGYPGDIMPSRKTHLIVIVGYEHERASEVIKALEPHSLSLGYGRADSATTEKDRDANAHYKGLVEQMASSYRVIDSFEVMCDNPIKTYEVLQEKIDAQTDRNIVVVPLNNKISTLGAAILAIKNERVQLCYAEALAYNYEDYSLAGSECYLIDFDDAGLDGM